MILRPGSEAEARRVFEKWELDFAVIGRVTETGRLVLRDARRDRRRHPGRAAGHRGAALRAAVAARATRSRKSIRPRLPDRDPLECLKQLLACPDLASKRWIWEQYDHLVMGNTVKRPGGDAAVVRVGDGGKALALATDCTPRYCRADPERGGAQAVAESWRNLTAVGAAAAGADRQHEFRQPGEARDHGPSSSARSKACARPAWRSTTRSSPAMSRSTTRPAAARSCRPR